MKKHTLSILASLTLIIFSGCSSGGKKSFTATPIPTLVPQLSVFSCAASSLKTEVESDELFEVSVLAELGTPPYKLNVGSDMSSFNAEKKMQVSLKNDSTTDKTLSGSVQVSDANSSIANCSYSIKVKAAKLVPICTDGGGLMFHATNNSCAKSLTSCQTTELRAQGFQNVVTRSQCNTYCGAVTNANCGALPDPDVLTCSIVPIYPSGQTSQDYIAKGEYKFEVQGMRRNARVELNVDSFIGVPTLLINEEHPVTKIRTISFPKSAAPFPGDGTQVFLTAKASLKSDSTVKCGGTSDGTITPHEFRLLPLPPLLCKIALKEWTGLNSRIKILATRAGFAVPIEATPVTSTTHFSSTPAYLSEYYLGTEAGTYAKVYDLGWNLSFNGARISFTGKADVNHPNIRNVIPDDCVEASVGNMSLVLY